MINIKKALEAIARGDMIIIVDDEHRENEGDLVVAAEKITPENITFMAKKGSGLICLSLTNAQADKLQLPLQEHGMYQAEKDTAFTYSIDARFGITTGVSSLDRVRTIQVAIDEKASPSDIVVPGHIFPLRARDGGVLERAGHTEASVDIAVLAGLNPSAVICEIMGDDGQMLRGEALFAFAKTHELPIISVQDIIAYRKAIGHTHTPLQTPDIHIASTCDLKTENGNFTLMTFFLQNDPREQVALIKGSLNAGTRPLLRLHSECLTGELLNSLHCDCGQQLKMALRKIALSESGILIYLRQEGRELGLTNKVRAYDKQSQGLDTIDANLALGLPIDNRNYAPAIALLKHFHIQQVALLTNNPEKIGVLEQAGFEVQREPLLTVIDEHNCSYIQTKRQRLAHLY